MLILICSINVIINNVNIISPNDYINNVNDNIISIVTLKLDIVKKSKSQTKSCLLYLLIDNKHQIKLNMDRYIKYKVFVLAGVLFH